MGQDLQRNFAHAAIILSSPQVRAQSALHSREHAFALPALSEAGFRKALLHLATVAACYDGTCVSSGIHRNGSLADSQFFPTQDVKRFCIKGPIGSQEVKTLAQGGLRDGFRKIFCVVTWLSADHHRRDQVGRMVADHDQFGPGPKLLAAAALYAQEVATYIAGFEAGPVN